jgi:hypothetical protein
LANTEENEVNEATKVEQNSQTKKSEEFLMLLGEDFSKAFFFSKLRGGHGPCRPPFPPSLFANHPF